MSLVNRIRQEHTLRGIAPTAELLAYADGIDHFAAGLVDADTVQIALCAYVDAVAIRNHALSATVGRTREPPLGDVFTEAAALLLDGVRRGAHLANHALVVASERAVRGPDNGSVKPDISLWKGRDLVAVIECKTNLGYARGTWREDYDARVSRLGRVGVPAAGVFLLVATERNWSGFPSFAEDPRSGNQWLALAGRQSWPGGKGDTTPLAGQLRPGVLTALIAGIARVLPH